MNGMRPRLLAADRIQRSLLASIVVIGSVLGVVVRGSDDLPAIQEIRIPADSVDTYFPVGTPLRVMPIDEWTRRIDQARRALEAADSAPAPRLLKAEHQARWMDGDVLEGRSRLTVDLGGAAPAAVVIDPWELPITTDPSPSDVRTRPDGRLVAWVEQSGVSTIIIPWRQPLRRRLDGLELLLVLPDCPISSLTLDIPAGQVPEVARAGAARRLESSDGVRHFYRIDNISGRSVISFRAADSSQRPQTAPWLSVRTLLNVEADGAWFDSQWTLDFPPHRPSELVTDWDPNLDVVAVEGTGVKGFEVEPTEDGGHRVRIQLIEGIESRSTIRLRGLARLPANGAWTIPRVRLPGAAWLGERTAVRLGPERWLAECRELGAVRVRPPAELRERFGRSAVLLAFEAWRDGPAAELVLGEPETPTRFDLRASIKVEPGRASLEGTATWLFRGTRPSTLSITIPEEWSCESVEILGLDEPTFWSMARDPGEGVLVTITPPLSLDGSNPLVARFRGTRSLLGTARLAVPRLRLSPGRPGDELWSLFAEDRIALKPLDDSGVDWLHSDMNSNEALPSLDPTKPNPRLAWRWLSDDASLELELRTIGTFRRATTRLLARVLGDDQIRLDAFLTLTRSDPDDTIIELLEPDAGAMWTWSLWQNGLDQPVKDLGTRSSAGLADSSSRRLRLLQIPPRKIGEERTTLHATRLVKGSRLQMPALPVLPGWSTGATFIVAAEDSRAVDLTGKRLIRLDAESAFAEANAEINDFALFAGTPLAELPHQLAFELASPDELIELQTRTLDRVDAGGIVLHAELRKRPGPDRLSANRLTLTLASGGLKPLRIALPESARLIGTSRDGTPFDPSMESGELVCPVEAPGPNPRSTITLVVDYLEIARPEATNWPVPRLSLPCLSSLLIVEGEAGDRKPMASALASMPMPLGFAYGASQPPKLRESETPRSEPGTLGASLGVFVSSGDWWIVDRLSLDDHGIDPLSQLPASEASLQGSEIEPRLSSINLRVNDVGPCRLLTWADTPPLSSADKARVAEAARDGQDRTGRYLSFERWLARGPIRPLAWDHSNLTPSSDLERFLIAGQPLQQVATRPRGGPQPLALGLVAALVVALGWPFLFLARTTRISLLILMLLALIPTPWQRPDWVPWIAAVSIGAGLLALLWLISPRLRPALSGNATAPSTLTMRPERVVASCTLAAALFSALGMTFAQEPTAVKPPEPILALLPFETNEQAALGPERAVVRLNDLERLDTLVKEAQARQLRAQESRIDGFGALSARHQIRGNRGRLERETIINLSDAGPAGASWPIQLDGWRGVTAQLDGRDVPIVVDADGLGGHVRVTDKTTDGGHQLVIKATLAADPLNGATLDVLPVARCVVEVEDFTASSTGLVGPISQFVVAAIGGAVEPSLPPLGLMILWDALPSGNLLELRLRNVGTTTLERLRLDLQDGSELLSIDPVGRRDRTASCAEAGSFEIDFEPPLAPAAIARFRVWTPRPDNSPSSGNRPRDLPRLTFPKARIQASQIALRAPTNWTINPAQPPAREGSRGSVADFLMEWGDLPSGGGQPVAAWEGPNPEGEAWILRPDTPPTHIRPEVQCILDGGRVSFRADAVFLELPPWLDSLGVRMPKGFRLYDVQGDGVIGWSRLSADQIQIRWDNAARPPERISLLGWIESARASGSVEGLSRELSLSLPEWLADVVDPAILSVSAAPEIAIDLEETPGWTRTTRSDPSASPQPVRAELEMQPGSPPTRLQYRMESRAADVRVFSHLTFQPDSVAWQASARYRVRGGPCREIRLEFPTSFAERFTIEVQPTGGRIQTTTLGETTRVEIRFDEPIWDEPIVLIRSTAPLTGRSLEFPTLVPLGLGRVDTYLGWVDASRLDFTAEGTAGIREVESSRFPAADLNLATQENRRVYHVLRAGWSLRLRPTRPLGNTNQARVLWAEQELQVDADGLARGRLLCVLDPASQGMLHVRVPEGIDVAGAHDGQGFLECYRASASELRISARTAQQVAVYWSAHARRDRPGQRSRLSLPVPLDSGIPLQVVWRDPTCGPLPSSESTALAVSSQGPMLVEKLEAASRFVEASLDRFDRSSAVAKQSLVLRLRDLGRLRSEVRRVIATSESSIPITTLQEMAETAFERVHESVRLAGLEPLWNQATAQDLSGTIQAPPPSFPQVGQAHGFRGTTTAACPSFRIEVAPRWATTLPDPRFVASVGLLLGACALVAAWLRQSATCLFCVFAVLGMTLLRLVG